MFKEKYTEAGLLYYSDIIPGIEHYFTTRGINPSSFPELMGLKSKNIINPIQTHSSNIEFAKVSETEYPNTDAIILSNFEQAVYLRFADCTPVIIFDKKANIASVVHAGWKGTAASIVQKTIQKMSDYTKEFLPENIYAVIGPAIGKCCYKVGKDVIEKIGSSVKNSSGLITEKEDEIYLDLKRTNARQLTEYGIPEENIDICPFCTSCDNNLFYSYRKENGTENRHYAIIKLKKYNT